MKILFLFFLLINWILAAMHPDGPVDTHMAHIFYVDPFQEIPSETASDMQLSAQEPRLIHGEYSINNLDTITIEGIPELPDYKRFARIRLANFYNNSSSTLDTQSIAALCKDLYCPKRVAISNWQPFTGEPDGSFFVTFDDETIVLTRFAYRQGSVISVIMPRYDCQSLDPFVFDTNLRHELFNSCCELLNPPIVDNKKVVNLSSLLATYQLLLIK